MRIFANTCCSCPLSSEVYFWGDEFQGYVCDALPMREQSPGGEEYTKGGAAPAWCPLRTAGVTVMWAEGDE